jgi:hypothetical protein
VQDRDTQQAPILGQFNKDGWGTLPGDSSIVGATTTSAGAGEYGTNLKTFNYALQLGVAKTLNNSKKSLFELGYWPFAIIVAININKVTNTIGVNILAITGDILLTN